MKTVARISLTISDERFDPSEVGEGFPYRDHFHWVEGEPQEVLDTLVFEAASALAMQQMSRDPSFEKLKEKEWKDNLNEITQALIAGLKNEKW